MPIYLKYADIKGDVTESSHEGWIECMSAQWGIGRGISSPTGNSADRESSAPSVSELVMTKNQDISSNKILLESLQGEGKDATVDFCKTEKGKLEIFMQYKLTNTMISGFSTSSGGDRPTESLSLNFTKFAVKASSNDATGKAGSPDIVTYDIAQAKVV